MKITYELQKHDLWNFYWFSTFKNTSLRKLWSLLTIIHFLFSFYPFFQPIKMLVSGEFWADVAIGSYLAPLFWFCAMDFAIKIVGTITITITITAIFHKISVNSHKNNEGTLGQHTLVFNENDLIEITDVNETKHSWKSIQKIIETKSLFLIYVSPTNAHIIPKRSFSSENEAKLFIEEVKRLKENSKSHYTSSYLTSNS